MKSIGFVVSAIAVVGFLSTSAVHASESPGNAIGPKYAKLEPITVNLQGLSHYLQTSITLKVASPQAEEAIKLYMPMIRHELILVFSSKEAGQVTSPEGKQKLIDETRRAANMAISMTEKQGVTDVLFESFVVQ